MKKYKTIGIAAAVAMGAAAAMGLVSRTSNVTAHGWTYGIVAMLTLCVFAVALRWQMRRERKKLDELRDSALW